MTRRTTTLQQRAIDRAIEGGRHRISIDTNGHLVILPLGLDASQADDAALDAEIREHLNDGHAAH